MNKRQFNKFIRDTIGDLSIERQEKELKKIDKYVSDYMHEITNGKTKCPKCGKYIVDKDLIVISENQVRTVNVFRDAGYGDDDEYVRAVYLSTYKMCPICKYKPIDIKYEYVREIE